MISAALYARVSSEIQAQNNTISSQVSALETRLIEDGHALFDEMKFIDNGYSGSYLNRPALEKLRDKISDGYIDKLYIHSPDRLSRKYAYQMILLEEFQKNGVEVIFLNHQNNDNPESHLLLQMQGMIAEYERAKIIERHRRGKIHAAKSGSVNVLGSAPYGYRYIDRNAGRGVALYEVHTEEAEVVKKIFSWVGHDRLSLGEVYRKLKNEQILSPKGKLYWSRSVIFRLLKNQAYKGTAAFGKTKKVTKLPMIRPRKGSHEQTKNNCTVLPIEKEKWILIPVPAIVDEALFGTVQEQLEENKKVARVRNSGASYLLQSLVVCQCCNYACHGKESTNNRGQKSYTYAYYHCIGKDAYRFGGKKVCTNQSMRADALDTIVWEEVKFLLRNPTRIFDEYTRRISGLEKSSLDHTNVSLEKQENKLKRGIARLIDSYAQEHIEKEEFEPRIKSMKQRLKMLEEQKQEMIDKNRLQNDLTLIATRLEYFASDVESKLEQVDWHTKRDIIRLVVKRVEIGVNDINVVFRIKELPAHYDKMERDQKSLQHCCMRSRARRVLNGGLAR